ncbi:MAG TPA: cell division protein [Phenylobacterium sp.]|nr:cell division protein [Phenylobacterium sp.]
MTLIERRWRGFRLIDLIAVGVLATLILGVYLAKTIAGGERAEIARVERRIDEEKARTRLLKAEVSHLEQPARVERLAEAYLGLAPVPFEREATLDALPKLAHAPVVRPRAPVEPTPDPTAVAEFPMAPPPAPPAPVAR